VERSTIGGIANVGESSASCSTNPVKGRWVEAAAANLVACLEHPAERMLRRRASWPDLAAVDSGSPSPFLNCAVVRRQPAEDAASIVERLDGFYGAALGGPWTLWSGWDMPNLARHGGLLIQRMPLMVRHPGGAPPPVPGGLRIVEVDSADVLDDWEAALIAGFPVPELAGGGPIWDRRVLGGRLRLWVGYADRRPVATAAAYVGDGLVGVYLVATLPEYRGRGFATALTWRAVLADPALPAVLQATELGRPVYERMGFAAVGEFAVWLKPRDPA
jgi:GNAT superfamily N-acetyltransferase